LSLCPDEDLIKLTSLSDRALFYKGEDSLKHKVLAIEEEAGALGADYAIRNLISAKRLVIETTIKNPLTGKMETQVNRVNGPASVLKTTTNPETNTETRSRFFITSVDESAEQTRAIVAAQRQRHTLEGLLRKKQSAAVTARHHAFQRMLKPVHVVNPFEPLLIYGDDRLGVRRDNPKYLSLILVVAFLHQMQRPVKHHPELGNYIEVTLDDIAIANDLALQLLGQSLDDLSSPSRELLRLISDHVVEKARGLGVKSEKVEFSRRELREAIGWNDTRLRTHLAELACLEYVQPLCGSFGKAFRYRMLYEGRVGEATRFVPGLKSVEQIRHEALRLGSGQANLAGILPHLAGEKDHLAPTSRAGSARLERVGFPSENGNGKTNLVASSGEHIREIAKNGALVTVGIGS